MQSVKQEQGKGWSSATLIKALEHENVPAISAIHIPIDVMWTVDGQPCAADLKTVQDFIASYTDGRLHEQITAMQQMNCRFFFLLIEGDPWSMDGGYTVGEAPHGWAWDAFDDAEAQPTLNGANTIGGATPD